jgi:hypothetical protein
MKRYAIMRVAKHKSLGSMAAAVSHALRARETPNADPDRAGRNQLLVLDGKRVSRSELRTAEVDTVMTAVERRLSHATHRMDRSVLGLELFCGTSPEWWQAATPEQRRTWRDGCLRWLAEEFGRENVMLAGQHDDETTPHVTAFVTPVRPDGRLSAAHWVGGGDAPGSRLSQMQDRHHAAVEAAGLERGIRGSKAAHQSVRRFYAAAEAPIPAVPKIGAPSRMAMLAPGGPEAFAEEETAKVRKATRGLARKAASAEVQRTRAEGAEATARALEAQRDRMRQQTAELRQLPLEQVLDRWKLIHDEQGSSKKEQQWRDAEGDRRIVFRNSDPAGVWYDHGEAKRGGKGAIDLVVHLTGCTPAQAIAALAARFGRGEAVRAVVADTVAKARTAAERLATEPPPPFQPPSPAPEQWGRARRWLVDARGIPAALVDEAHSRGDLYADRRANVVAVQRDPSGAAVGAELRGTGQTKGGFAGVATGSQPKRGMWTLAVGVDSSVPNSGAPLVLAESVVDALSVAAIQGPDRPAIYGSTAGNGAAAPDHPVVMAAMEEGRTLAAAVDRDKVGRVYLAAYVERWGERVRETLPRLKDWNDQLRAKIAEGWKSTWGRRTASEGDGAAPTPSPEASEAPRPS